MNMPSRTVAQSPLKVVDRGLRDARFCVLLLLNVEAVLAAVDGLCPGVADGRLGACAQAPGTRRPEHLMNSKHGKENKRERKTPREAREAPTDKSERKKEESTERTKK